MPGFIARLARAAGLVPETKASAAFALYGEGRAVWTARDYTALAREGFQRNAVVHRSVRLVASGVATTSRLRKVA